MAAGFKNELERTEGYLRSERFKSLVNEGKLLSLSVWENELAVQKWRNSFEHRLSQRQGHDSLFESYTITVASPIRSYTETDRGGDFQSKCAKCQGKNPLFRLGPGTCMV